MSVYAYVWEFRVRPGSKAAFESAYGPDGDWVRLFRRGEGYLGTDLLCDDRRLGRYLTVDRWRDRASYDAFRERFREEHEALDTRCEELTVSETRLGEFELVE